MLYMSYKKLFNVFIVVLIILVLFLAREDLLKAWQLLGQVNLWILWLIVPVQFLSYYASGAILFVFLQAKGDLSRVGFFEKPVMALELNFVNHILPTAGVSGASYMTWRLSKLGVNTGRATLAQIVRFAMMFFSYAALLLVAVVMVTVDGSVTRMTILVTSTLIGLIVFGTMLTVYAISGRTRMQKLSHWIDVTINRRVAKLIRSKKHQLVDPKKIEQVLSDLHDDYLALRSNLRILVKPFLWGVVFNIMEAAMYFVAFLALGAVVNPAPILISIGLAGLVASIIATPGGAGGYELAMAFFLSSAGVPSGLVAAGIVLTRTILIIMTIISGYFFYQRALKKYGKSPA